MKKRFLILLLAVLCAAALPLLANAESSGLCGYNVKWKLDDDGLLNITGDGKMDSFVDREAPWGKSVTKVLIQDGVTNIGAEAFSACNGLASVSIPNTVTTIESEAFAYCSALNNVSIPNSVTVIQSSAFSNCSGLKTISIPDSVTEIGERAFYKCYNLEKATIPNSVTIIGDDAFARCSNLTIYCYSGSPAQQYAEENGIPVELLDTEPAPAPEIITQPADVTVSASTTATFTVVSDSDCTYQWYCLTPDGSDWEKVNENGTSETLRFTASPLHNGNQYFCRLTNEEGTSTDSDPATLTVITKPTFTLQPTSVRVTEGETATFTVASDDADSFQWYYRTSVAGNWTKVEGNGTSPVYSVVAEAQFNGYQYYCEAKNSVDSAISDIVTLAVDTKPIITSQPTDVVVNEGKAATFKVTATNVDTYQWYYRASPEGEWKPVTVNGNKNIYSLTAQARHNGYQYRCLLTNDIGVVYTDTVTLTVKLVPVITIQPKDVTVKAGDLATFSVTATGASSYQWYYRTSSNDVWSVVGSSATEPTYTLLTEPYQDGYQFRCLVKNNVGAVYTKTVTLTVSVIPVISKQPANVTVKEGETAIFKVTSSNAESYRWYYRTSSTGAWTAVLKNGASNTLKIETQPRHNHYQYRCLLKNSAGSVYSKVATLTVLCKPIITAQPTDVTVNEGEKATFKVTASEAVNYQWYYRVSPTASWTAVRNLGTSPSYSLTTEFRHNGYQYRCKLTNNIGSVFTKTVTLTVTQKPTITVQPTNVSVNIGNKATFTVKAEKATSYQWYYRDPAVGTWTKVQKNGTSATYSLTAEKRHDRYQYRCLVSNKSGSVYTKTVTLTVVYVPVITAHPQSVKVAEGAKATFTVKATNAASYKWYYRKTADSEWVAVSKSGTSASYSLTVSERHNGYQYRCMVKNSYGTVYSNPATLTVLKLPTIKSQPDSITVNAGSKVAFTVVASNTTGYQWYSLQPGDSTWKLIKGATDSSYVFQATAQNSGYKYRCELKNSAGTVTTSAATLTVK